MRLVHASLVALTLAWIGLVPACVDTSGQGALAAASLAPIGIHATARARDRAHVRDEPDRSRKREPARSGVTPETTTYALTLLHVHTRELLPLGGDAREDSRVVERFLRCRVTGQVHPIAHELLHVVRRVAVRFGAERVEIVSGYRSDKLNELLRKKGHQVASSSLHMAGQAIDFRVPGTPARVLARAVAHFHEGGLGTYEESDFVHIDVGRSRRWRGT